MQKSLHITLEGRGEKTEFSSFSDFLKFYYNNIISDNSVSWTDFVYNNYSNGQSSREINGYTITGANEVLQAEILDYYRRQGHEVGDKSSGFNIGCKITNDGDAQYVKTPSTGVTGRYNWLNEIFIYKLLEKLGYGPKVDFNILDACPLILIRAEDVKKETDTYVEFAEGEHKSVGMKERITKDELKNIGAAEVLVGKVLLLDDLHYKEGTNYSFTRNHDGKLELKIFDCMSQHFGNDLKPLNKDFSFSQEKQCFYAKRHPYYAVSGSFLAEDVRNFGIDLGIEEIEKNKEKFHNAIKESETETYQILDKIKEKFPEKDYQKAISELYNQEAFHQFRRTVSNNLENIHKFHSSAVAIKPSAAFVQSNDQDIKPYGKQMAVFYNGKNNPTQVKKQRIEFESYLGCKVYNEVNNSTKAEEHRGEFQDYLLSSKSSDSLIKK